MSRQQVRSYVANYIQAANIPNLNVIWQAMPKRFQYQQNATAGQLCRAQALVHIARETESRIAVGGPSDGWKRVDYEVHFQIYSHNGHPLADDAMTDFDALVDAVKAQLRTGYHRLGNADGSIIWEAAEDTIESLFGEPATNDGGFVEIWATIIFTVTQMIRS